jgi:ankyrin repeat-rich membrane spanning protein
VARLLISFGADINALDDQKQSPLACACVAGSLGLVKLLVKNGCDIFTENEHNACPFTLACFQGSKHILEVLLNAGYKDRINDKKYGLGLGIVCSKVNLDALKVLLKAGMNPNPNVCVDGDTPLIKAIKTRNFKMAELLVLAGADVNDVNKAGCTPFRLAAREGLSCVSPC